MDKYNEIINTFTETIRKKSKKERWLDFESKLNTLPSFIEDDSIKGLIEVNTIKHNIIIFSMKDKFDENNDVFINNCKKEFYDSIDKLSELYPGAKYHLLCIKLFVDDFYLNEKEV